MKNRIKAGILGFVADALGVPAEFKSSMTIATMDSIISING